jgi:TrwC relaxase
MSVIVTVQSGFDLEYYIAQTAKESEMSPGGYYINASTRKEAPGRWFGEGCTALGIAGEVEPGTFRQVYSLVNPLTSERLGGARRDFTIATKLGLRSCWLPNRTRRLPASMNWSSKPGVIPGSRPHIPMSP